METSGVARQFGPGHYGGLHQRVIDLTQSGHDYGVVKFPERWISIRETPRRRGNSDRWTELPRPNKP